MMAILDDEIKYFEENIKDLTKHYDGKWVIVHNSDLAGSFDTFDDAAKVAIEKFGKGPYLIRQVGASPITLPASILYRPSHATL